MLFLHVEGNRGEIKGEATDRNHKDWIELASWAFSPVTNTLRVQKRFDRASPSLLGACCTGTRLDRVQFDSDRKRGELIPAFVSSVEIDMTQGSTSPVETVEFIAQQSTCDHQIEAAAGALRQYANKAYLLVGTNRLSLDCFRLGLRWGVPPGGNLMGLMRRPTLSPVDVIFSNRIDPVTLTFTHTCSLVLERTTHLRDKARTSAALSFSNASIASTSSGASRPDQSVTSAVLIESARIEYQAIRVEYTAYDNEGRPWGQYVDGYDFARDCSI
jgi:type VI protein secretion system component Hcp